jgi:putative membrane protein
MLSTPEIDAFVSAFPFYMMEAGATLALFVIGLTIYVILTPHKELTLIRDGNASAALAFGGVVVGLAIPLGACLTHMNGVMEILVWGTFALLIQLIVFRFTDMFLRGLPRRIQENDVAAAIFLMAVKIGVAIILAGALADPNANLFSAAALTLG